MQVIHCLIFSSSYGIYIVFPSLFIKMCNVTSAVSKGVVIQDAQDKSTPMECGIPLGLQKCSWLPRWPINYTAFQIKWDSSNMASRCKRGQVQDFKMKFDNRPPGGVLKKCDITQEIMSHNILCHTKNMQITQSQVKAHAEVKMQNLSGSCQYFNGEIYLEHPV